MIAIILIILAITSRFIPHLDNAAAITAVSVFAGFFLPRKQSLAVPLVARFATDLVIGFFAWQMMLAVYASHLVGVGLGLWIKKTRSGSMLWLRVIGSGLAASVVFFLITNFAFLYPMYPHTWSGIVLAYQNGLPFFRGTAVGDVGYTVVLFGLYFVSERLVHVFRFRQSRSI